MITSVSIIVPTYHEAENLPHLMERIAASLNATELKWSVIVVDDDSQDETVAVCEGLSEKFPLELIVRKSERGLSTAVVAGMRASEAETVLCIDADLSHPPEAIPAMIETLSAEECDFVIGSRYVAGGTTDDEWGIFRWLNSVIATGLAKPLTSANDPMAGFFALRKSDFDAAASKLDVIGYKIGLELIVKCDCREVREVPIHFADRQFGESKLSLKEQLNYLRHLKKLYTYRWPEVARFIRFGMVGSSGVIVNMVALSLLIQLSVTPPLAMAIAIWIAMSSNFFLNREFTFQDRTTANFVSDYVRFCLASLTGAALNWSVATFLWSTFSLFENAPTLAGLVGIAAGLFVNFTLCRRFGFFGKKQAVQESAGQKNNETAAGTPASSPIGSR